MAQSSDGSNGSAMDRLRTMMNVPPSSRPAEWRNPLEKIEELLSCAICLDRFKTPKLLGCQHTFCMDCLEGLADPVRRNLKCPECRAEHPLPYEGVKGLQTNYTLMGFLEIHLQATEDNAEELEAYIKRYNLERCKVCDEKAEVDFCHHCQKKVCDTCRTTHLDMVKRDLGRLTTQIKRLSNRITEASDGLSKGLESLTLNCDSTKEDVRDSFKRLYKDLKKREDKFVTEVETFHAVETRLMKGLRESLELESSNVNEACAKVEAFMKGEREISDEDVVRYKQMFADGLDFLRSFSLDADDLCMKKIRFNLPQEAAQTLQLGVNEFGELQLCAPQFGGRFQQLEAHYVPRLLNIGLESDAAAKSKRRNFDMNDATTWGNTGQQNGNGKGKDGQGGSRFGTRGVTSQAQGDGDSYSLRFRRRHQLEEEAWNRLRGDRKGNADVSGNPRRSPRMHEEELMNTSGHGDYVRQQLEESPFSKVQTIADNAGSASGTAGAASNTLTVTTAAATSARASPRGSASPSVSRVPSPSTVKPTPEETALNEKVDNIRMEHSKKSKTSPNGASSAGGSNSKTQTVEAKKQVAGPPQFLKPKATKAQTSPVAAGAASGSSNTSSGEEEKETPAYRQIPILHYPSPKPAPPAETPREKRESSSAQPSPIKSPAANPAAMDWKKYLIPSPGLNLLPKDSSSRISSFTDENIDTSSGGTSNASDPSWNDRRKRFVRSKTNPDLLPSISQSRLSEYKDTSTNKYGDSSNDRKGRYGLINTSPQESKDDADIDSSNAGAGNYYRKREQGRYRRKTDRSGSYVDQPANNALPVGIQPKNPYLDKGRVYRKFGAKGGADSQFNWPRGIALIPGSEEIAVCDSSNHRVQVFDRRGNFLQTFGTYGSGKGEFDCLAGIAVNKYKQFVVTDRYNHRVQVFDSQGRVIREFGSHGQTNSRFNNPWGVVVDNQGFIYVCDKDNHRVQIFQADGNFVGKFGGIGSREGQFQNPHFIAVNKQNMLIVTDSSNHRVQVFDHNGHFQFTFGSEGFMEGQFKYPRGVAVDEQGFILVADSGNNRIQVFTPDGRFYCSFGSWGAGDGQLKGVEGVAISLEGRVVVTDRENHRIQVF